MRQAHKFQASSYIFNIVLTMYFYGRLANAKMAAAMRKSSIHLYIIGCLSFTFSLHRSLCQLGFHRDSLKHDLVRSIIHPPRTLLFLVNLVFAFFSLMICFQLYFVICMNMDYELIKSNHIHQIIHPHP